MNDSDAETPPGADRQDDTPTTQPPDLGAMPVAVAVCGVISLLVVLPMPVLGIPLAVVSTIVGIFGVVRQRGSKRHVYLVGMITGLLTWILLGVAAFGLFAGSTSVDEENSGTVDEVPARPVESSAQPVPSG